MWNIKGKTSCDRRKNQQDYSLRQEMALNTEVGLAQNPLRLQKLWATSEQSNFTDERTAYVSVDEPTFTWLG